MLFFYHLCAGNDEVHSIQSQLHGLKLNPYHEMKLFYEGREDAAADPQVPAITDNSSDVLRAKDISGQLSDIELSQSIVGPSYAQYQSSINYQQQQFLHQQQQQQQQMMANGLPGQFQNAHSENFQQQQQFHHLQQQQQQQQQMMMNMGQQFMYAMQKSVSQVINAPHFGFEWVKPDYYFDPIDEDVKPVISSPYHINKDDDTESSVNSVVSDSEIRELYNALEEFTNKEDAQELLQYGSVQ